MLPNDRNVTPAISPQPIAAIEPGSRRRCATNKSPWFGAPLRLGAQVPGEYP